MITLAFTVLTYLTYSLIINIIDLSTDNLTGVDLDDCIFETAVQAVIWVTLIWLMFYK